MFSISHALILSTQINKSKIVWCNVLVHYNIQETTNATEWHSKIYNDSNMTSRAPNMQIYYTLWWQQKRLPPYAQCNLNFKVSKLFYLVQHHLSCTKCCLQNYVKCMLLKLCVLINKLSVSFLANTLHGQHFTK